MSPPPSGRQYDLVNGEQRATIVEVGGGIRSYQAAGRNVLDPYPVNAICDGAHGQPLIPWPNRLQDGRYTFQGVEYQLPLTEPEKSNAIHGLLRWRPWSVAEREDDFILLTTRLHPQPGYPFMLEVKIEYQLDEAGLTTRIAATNLGDRTCPYGCGQHPYLSAGDGLLDDCTMQLGAATRLDTDPERQLPIGNVPVTDSSYDFRQPRRIGSLQVDYAFTGLDRDPTGKAWVRLTRPDRCTAELWVDDNYPLIEIYTGDTLAPSRRRRGLGTEPMTCPPNAFRTGTSLQRLDPGETYETTWGARLL